ncbi:MAG: flagellar assembly protein FliX [Alphaproteobacteria bacterium]
MKIGGVGSTKSSSGTKKSRAVSSTGSFAELLDVSASKSVGGVDAASQVSAAAPVSNLLAAQEVFDDLPHQEALVKEGEATLDMLESLRRNMLAGAIPVNLLAEIKGRITRKKQHTSDPYLRAIMDEIELRASVELAKLEVALANRQAAKADYTGADDI